MASEGQGSTVEAADDGYITVVVIPAESPETPGRITIPQILPHSTIGQLRHRISAVLPSHPAVQRIRLISAGALLTDDNRTLEQVAGAGVLASQKMLILHLALRPAPNNARTVPSNPPNSSMGTGPSPPDAATQTNPVPPPTAAAQARSAIQEHERVMRQQQAMLRQHMEATQAAFQQAAFQQAQRARMVAVPAWPNAMPQAPNPASAPGAVPLQDFQRHVNQQHTARFPAVGGTGSNVSEQPVNAAAPRQQEHDAQPPPLLQMGHNAFVQPGQVFGVPPQVGRPPGSGTQGTWSTRIEIGNNQMALNGNLPPNIMQNTMHAGSMMMARQPQDSLYLISSPDGYHAILMSPPAVPTPTYLPSINATTASIANTAPPQQAVLTNNQPQPNQRQPNQPQQLGVRDLLAMLVPFGGHVWLVIRLTFFAIILTWGATWRRTVLIYLGAILIFLSQTGLLTPMQNLAEHAWVPVRRHIEDLVRDIENERQEPAAANERPDPQQVADRLLRRQRDQGLIRRAERSIALFIASFVPGVGEAQIAAREERERQRRQARQQDEQERLRREEEEAAASAATAADATAGAAIGAASNDQASATSRTAGEAEHISPVDIGPSPWTGSSESADQSGLRQRQPHVEDASDDSE